MLLPCTCQKLICSSNATFKLHMPVSSCAYLRQLCQYICLIWTHYNQQCDQKHWYNPLHNIGICPWTNMPPKLHIYIALHYHCSLHIDHTLLHIQVQKTTNYNSYLVCYIHTCGNNKYAPVMPKICHICQSLHVKIGDNHVIHIPHMNSLQWLLWPGELVYMHSTLWSYGLNKYASPIAHICSTALLL